MELTLTDKIMLMEARLKEAIDRCRKARKGTIGDRGFELRIAMRETKSALLIGSEVLEEPT